MKRALVISQLPPPIHGSTMMTQLFVDVLDDLDVKWKMLERRFSTSVDEVGRFSLKKALSGLWMPFRLLASLIVFKPQVVVFFATNRTFSFIVDWSLSEILRLACNRRILYIHTIGFRALAQRGPLWAWLVKRLLNAATAVVCLGPSLATDIQDWVDESRISFIPNAAPERSLAHPQRETTSRKQTVLYLSNLIPEKGAEDFVKMAIEAAASLPHVHFIIAGATSNSEFTASLHKMVESSFYSEHIDFRGSITDQQEKWTLLEQADVLVFPSKYPFEAQPLTILEAMSVGTPIIAYNMGGIKDILDDSLNGFLLQVGDMQGLLGRVLDFMKDKHLQERMGQDARKIYETRFGRVRYMHSWDRLL